MVANYAQKFPLNIIKEMYYNYVMEENMKKKFLTGIDILKKELQGDYNFFTKEANNNKKSKGLIL